MDPFNAIIDTLQLNLPNDEITWFFDDIIVELWEDDDEAVTYIINYITREYNGIVVHYCEDQVVLAINEEDITVIIKR